jgi:hypothetical protein
MQSSVRIANPPAGKGFTHRRRAEQFVRRGRARWIDEHTIEFIPCVRQTAIVAAARASQIDYDRAAHTGCASRQAIRNLPMVGDIDRLLGRGRVRRTSAKATA